MGRLEKHIKQVRGLAYKKDEISEEPLEDFVPVLKANNITADGLSTVDLIYIHHDRIKPEQFIKKGDLLLAASSGSKKIVGKNIYFESDYDGSFGAFCKLIRPKNSVYAPFLKHFFQTDNYKRHIEGLIQGANINNLRNEHIDSLSLPELAINDQIRIAKVLSKVERLITQRKESIFLLDELVKSTFLEMFGDPALNNKKLPILKGGDYCKNISVGVVIKPASYYVEKGVIALRSLNIKPNRFDLTNLVYFSKEDHEKTLSKSILHEGDVVLVRTGNTGTAAVIPEVLDGCNCIDLLIVRPKIDIVNPFYVSYLFNSDRGKLLVAGKEVGGIHKHFNVGAIKEMAIPIPPIKEQNKFANIVLKSTGLKTIYESSLQELENLYNTLSQLALKGELDLSKLEIDHIIPISQGGTDDEENLQLVSSRENRRASDRPKTTRIGNVIMGNFYEEDVAELLKEYFGSFDFRFSEVIEFFEEEKAVAINYLTSEELKRNRNQMEKDIKTFIFSCVENKNPHLKLEQKFINAFEDVELKKLNPKIGRDSLLAKLNSSPAIIDIEDISGIYFRIIT